MNLIDVEMVKVKPGQEEQFQKLRNEYKVRISKQQQRVGRGRVQAGAGHVGEVASGQPVQVPGRGERADHDRVQELSCT